MHPPILSVIDLLLSSFALGATTWLFFVQSPVLIRWMGRDRFVPIQMRLTRTLFATLSWVLAAVLATVWLRGDHSNMPLSLGAVVAFLGAAVTSRVILPRALRAGARGKRETKERGDDASVADFASEGTGPSARAWHRTVVGFVIVTLGGLLAHMGALLPHGAHAAAQAHHDHAAPDALALDDGKRWVADVHTTRSVLKLRELVARARGAAPRTAATWSSRTGAMSEAFAEIFRGCRMEGPAHEQLHAFLLPLGPELDRLRYTEPGAADASLEKIQRHLERYETYFE